jgi:hypothetical protein
LCVKIWFEFEITGYERILIYEMMSVENLLWKCYSYELCHGSHREDNMLYTLMLYEYILLKARSRLTFKE